MKEFKYDLYRDHITGLDNFFSFIQSDFQKMFGNKGVIVVIDIANFMDFNNRYGRTHGDEFLKCVSEAIYLVLSDNPKAFTFRTHGDEFTCIFPSQVYNYGKTISNLINSECKTIMNKLGFNDIELHTLALEYDHEISSVEAYYELLVRNSINQPEQTENKFSGERLLRHIIGGITNRVRDTLSYYEDVYNFALVDDISGLANHKAGMIFLSNLLEEYKASKPGFSILFIDGDNLRRYNKISYESGNNMIRKLGQIIKSSIRVDDKVFRWLSGDEFLVILKETNEINALKLADRIRASVEELTKDCAYPTTISVGLACYPNDGIIIGELISKAEKANALAKSLGKNKVVKWTK